jgi:hypothetical protein
VNLQNRIAPPAPVKPPPASHRDQLHPACTR